MKRKYPDDPAREVFEAAKSGDAVLLNEVLQHGANVDRRDEHGNTALHYAVDNDKDMCDVVSCLIKNGADVNARTTDLYMYNRTPLMIASKKGLVNVVTFIIEHGANVDLKDKNGKTALHYAVDGNQKEDLCDVVNCLIKNGADVNARTTDLYNYTPLMIASKQSLVNVVTFLIENGANVDLQDVIGKTALHHAVPDHDHQDSCDVVSCLIKNGADVNAHALYDGTPLMLASREGHLNLVTFLLEHGADMNLQDEKGQTALHYAAFYCKIVHCDVLSFLIDNGADVNACDFDNCHPLMTASKNGLVNVVTFLVKRGANMDFQDKKGNTALHHAARWNRFEVVNKLLSLGASQLCNSQGLTPLLSASNMCAISVVENLITRPECTKEQRIDALELLGSSLVTRNRLRSSPFVYGSSIGKGFEYIKRGMEERFADPSHPLLKQPMEPVEAYQNRKESQTPEELARIEHNLDAIVIESLIMRERILGTNNAELLIRAIRKVARYYRFQLRHPICSLELYRHSIKIAQSCGQSAISDFFAVATFILEETVQSYDFPREQVCLELLEQTVFEYDKQRKMKGVDNESYQFTTVEENLEMLFNSVMDLVQRIAKRKHSDEFQTSHVSVLLKRVFCLNPQDLDGNTLLHSAVDKSIRFWNDLPPNCTDTVKLLLNEGFNVNAVNNNGDTPLHRAVTFVPKSDDEMHVLTDMLEVLLDGGAHHDFVNNDGKTAMDMARTGEACNILLEKRKLELKCISARAVKKYGLTYLGIVPKTLEKFISMH